ncbi:hypothetical protein [Streptomyces sp. ISL-100]|uniref:hypothetical protein n=1 Tax=Streptomyces sp. ISL-100 TaxID=2819173 RepID=UPI001BE56565|nr:hypothetical protein [Streptomyces sp. ISL-100]MBT2395813.1 hypothetical protein [Streptomyces sp. ISL-100]
MPERVFLGVMELLDPVDPSDPVGPDDVETVRPGPLWHHALWVAGIIVVGVGMGWASALIRIGPESPEPA